MMKRVWALLLTLAVVAGILTGCNIESGSQQGNGRNPSYAALQV